MDKTCNTCDETKEPDAFPKHGKGRRPICKLCFNDRMKNSYKSKATGVQKAVAYIDIPQDFKIQNYRETIHRLRAFGIMSDEYAEEAFARVDALGK